jgi:prolyl-tRNA editing enzyme YbaK/EbsC (Cys-tRNA(Pro) deacylase)
MSLSLSAKKVQEALDFHDIPLQVVELPASTRTAVEAAHAIGCQVAQIAKSLIFEASTSGRPVLIIASGINRVNEQKISELLGETLKKASADFVRERTGFAIGGVPPVAHSEPLLTFLDKDLLQYAEIWAAAGTPNAVFKLTPSELTNITQGKVIQVT